MRPANEQIVAHQSCQVGRQRSVAQFLPPRIYELPNARWEGNPFRFRIDRRRLRVPRHRTEFHEALDDLHEQPLARLAGPVTGHDLGINCVLRGQRIARDGQRDRAPRSALQIVTDQIDGKGGKRSESELLETKPQGRSQQAGHGDILADSFEHRAKCKARRMLSSACAQGGGSATRPAGASCICPGRTECRQRS